MKLTATKPEKMLSKYTQIRKLLGSILRLFKLAHSITKFKMYIERCFCFNNLNLFIKIRKRIAAQCSSHNFNENLRRFTGLTLGGKDTLLGVNQMVAH